MLVVIFSDRSNIDWDKRKKELLKVVEKYRNESNWGCIVPVSEVKTALFKL